MAKRLCKRARLARENFRRAVTEYLVSKGATPDSFYEYRIETKAGLLHVTPYEDWIAACFADVERAQQLLGSSLHGRLNPRSGKWNFHFADETLEGTVALNSFISQMERLLPDVPPSPSPTSTYRKEPGHSLPGLDEGWAVYRTTDEGQELGPDEELLAIVTTETLADAVIELLHRDSREVARPVATPEVP